MPVSSSSLHFVVTLAAFAATTALHAQQPAQIPIRSVTTLASTDSGVIANVYVVRVMSDGTALLNDAVKRRLLLIDTTMKKYTVVADTAGESKMVFGAQPGGLLFYPGDSAVFVDRLSQALVVIHKDGQVGATFSPPKVADMQFFVYSSTANYGLPGFDAKGRLYYRASLPPIRRIYDASTTNVPIVGPDSAPIVRADLDARRIDTIAYLRIPAQISKAVSLGNGGFVIMQNVNPVPVMDDWTYFDDGTVAIIRAGDYHVDWILPDGSRKATPKMPFDWKRLTSEEKQQMIDSTAHRLDSVRTESMARSAAANGGKQPANGFYPVTEVVPASALPDYYPPLRVGTQVRVDLDGNMWVMPSTSLQAQGGLLFDVINRKGEIIERVQLPAGRNLHGFAPGGIIYMSIPGNMNAQFGFARLERAKVVRP